MTTQRTTNAPSDVQIHQFGEWTFDYSNNELKHLTKEASKRLEPKVGELLHVLIMANGRVVSKHSLLDHVWSGLVVGDDTLARAISRLRAALEDSAANPQYIETIPKKGYRLKAECTTRLESSNNRLAKSLLTWFIFILFFVAAVVWYSTDSQQSRVSEILVRADGLYMTFEEGNNEAALALYESVLNLDAQNARAQAGIANAMVQRLVRWPSPEFTVDASGISLTKALSTGQLSTPESKLMLESARLMAEKSVRNNPRDVQAIKSLGFVYSAEGRIEQAIKQYQRAIELSDTAWRSMINLGELYELNNQSDAALAVFIQAYDAMQKKYQDEPQHIGPWQPELGNAIAKKFLDRDDFGNAETWAERVLNLVPFNRDATTILVSALRKNRQHKKVAQICENYAAKLEPLEVCKSLGNASLD